MTLLTRSEAAYAHLKADYDTADAVVVLIETLLEKGNVPFLLNKKGIIIIPFSNKKKEETKSG